jgi:hypothetical protein
MLGKYSEMWTRISNLARLASRATLLHPLQQSRYRARCKGLSRLLGSDNYHIPLAHSVESCNCARTNGAAGNAVVSAVILGHQREQ